MQIFRRLIKPQPQRAFSSSSHYKCHWTRGYREANGRSPVRPTKSPPHVTEFPSPLPRVCHRWIPPELWMAGTCSRVTPHVIGSTIAELSRTSRTGALLPVRISARSHGVSTCDESEVPQGPSCIFVGPIETAPQETLEALYCQVCSFKLVFLTIFFAANSNTLIIYLEFQYSAMLKLKLLLTCCIWWIL